MGNVNDNINAASANLVRRDLDEQSNAASVNLVRRDLDEQSNRTTIQLNANVEWINDPRVKHILSHVDHERFYAREKAKVEFLTAKENLASMRNENEHKKMLYKIELEEKV